MAKYNGLFLSACFTLLLESCYYLEDTVQFTGAQSDSEVNVTGNQGTDDGTNRGYTSDSELYGTRHDNRSSQFPNDIRHATSTHGSWLMVRLVFHSGICELKGSLNNIMLM